MGKLVLFQRLPDRSERRLSARDNPGLSGYARRMDYLIKAAQFLIAAAVMCAAIYAEQSLGYDINGYIVGAWGFMAAYGATWLVVQLLDRRVREGRILPRFGRKQASD